jgi:tetratricopeptide (TPR) repeat protein
MLSNVFKAITGLFALVLMALNIYWGNYGYAVMWLLLLAICVLLLWRHERIIMALYYMQKQDVDKTKQWLSNVKKPEYTFLLRTQLAYYYYILGMVSAQKDGINKAEVYIRKSLDLGLRMELDQAMAKMQLAGILASRRQIQAAQKMLDEAQKLDKKGVLRSQIDMFRKQLKAPTQTARFR